MDGLTRRALAGVAQRVVMLARLRFLAEHLPGYGELRKVRRHLIPGVW
jgi:hypothetical protein